VRRLVSAIALVALASAPVVQRTRLFCRFSGVEITDCVEQDAPDHPAVQPQGCCERQVTRPLAAVRNGQREISPPPPALPLPAAFSSAAAPAQPRFVPALRQSAGPPLYLITRALLI
jgi:hypothetical protein